MNARRAWWGGIAGIALAACAPAGPPAGSPPPSPSPAPPPFMPSANDVPTGLWGEHVSNVETLPVWEAPALPVLPGATYSFYSVECTYAELPDRHVSRCEPRSSPLESHEQYWSNRLNRCFRLEYMALPAGAEPPSDPQAFVMQRSNMTVLVDEVESHGCESRREDDPPCDPVQRRTGRRVPRTSTQYSLRGPQGSKMGYAMAGGTMNVFPPQAVNLFFFSPRYPNPKGTLRTDGRFLYDTRASDAEMRALLDRLESIDITTSFELVRAAVALDRAVIAVRLRDEALVARAAKELERFAASTTLGKEEAEHWASSGGYRNYVRAEIEAALKEIRRVRDKALLLRDPCGG